MITHNAIWSAIDSLAQRRGLSVSALARMAGLDPTAFNPSKRVSKDGRERWPSTESIAKVLDTVGESMDRFLSGGGVYEQRERIEAAVPLLGFSQAGVGGFFDSGGVPVGTGWDQVNIPFGPDSNIYALEVSDDSMLPLYHDGDRIIVSPSEQIRRGDRVVVRMLDGAIMARIMHRQTANIVGLLPLDPEQPAHTLQRSDIDWIARILWVSQ